MSTPHDILLGAAAGLAATGPMTAVMKALHTQLPPGEQYPLPPRQITMNVARTAGVEPVRESDRKALTIASHFAYGAACGALYAGVADRLPGHPVAKGIGFGLAVWAGSYLGWLPAAGLLSPATEHPARRNALMIAAHVVWGATAGAAYSRMAEEA
ncbi:MAG TPA: DUF6789 family protein [Beijerinckiaceae bacterium]|nr:DUF6789 family protein [Beijerinckiaceae bacterium]